MQDNLKATSASKYKVGIIGCSWIAIQAPDNHLKAYQECPDTFVVALCDLDRRKMPFGYHEYTDYFDMVGEHLDIVSVCTPVKTHAQIVCDIAPYVKAIYCEKPMATTVKDCTRMIEACEQHGTILQINHQRRFINPLFQFGRDIVDTGTHAFDLLLKLFGPIQKIKDGEVYFVSGQVVEVQHIPTTNHLFTLDCTRGCERMITQGVVHLVDCLKNNHRSCSSGYEGRKALYWTLKFKEMNESI